MRNFQISVTEETKQACFSISVATNDQLTKTVKLEKRDNSSRFDSKLTSYKTFVKPKILAQFFFGGGGPKNFWLF